MSSVWALGINHKTAPLDLRGRLTIGAEQLPQALHGVLSAVPDASECVIVSTCNRTELYFCGAYAETSHQAALGWLAQWSNERSDALSQHTYVLANAQQTATHACRMASGLDSMVLGEAQVLGQVKDAVRVSQSTGTAGTVLQQLFQKTFAVAKDVRTHTDVGRSSISMTAAAVRLCAHVFEDLRDIRVLFVGAGEMISLAMTHFAAQQPAHMCVANRTHRRAQEVAQQFGADAMLLSDMPDALHSFDAVVSCTARSLPIISKSAIERALKKRKYKPMFVVDLAVPRDVEAQVQDIEDVYLYTVDDLAQVVQVGQEKRQQAAEQAKQYVDDGVDAFCLWLEQRAEGATDTIQQLQQQVQAWQQLELEKAAKAIERGVPPHEAMQALSKGLSNKFLHGVYKGLSATDEQERQEAKRLIERFFVRY